jgi:hypothetical protein
MRGQQRSRLHHRRYRVGATSPDRFSSPAAFHERPWASLRAGSYLVLHSPGHVDRSKVIWECQATPVPVGIGAQTLFRRHWTRSPIVMP